MSIHAADELEDDGPSVLDLEGTVLTRPVAERRRDRSSRELEVVVRGQGLACATSCTVAEVGPTGRAIVITVHVEGRGARLRRLRPSGPADESRHAPPRHGCGSPRHRGPPRPLVPVLRRAHLTADTLHEIERSRALRKAVSVVRPVAVETFA